MANPELGTKRVCPTTGRKFYDLNKDPIVSPYTGEAFPRSVFEPQAKPSRSVAPEADDDETPDAAAADTVSLDDVEAAEDSKAESDTDDSDDIESNDSDDSFLEEEADGDDDVSDLIDGDIEDDEEI